MKRIIPLIALIGSMNVYAQNTNDDYTTGAIDSYARLIAQMERYKYQENRSQVPDSRDMSTQEFMSQSGVNLERMLDSVIAESERSQRELYNHIEEVKKIFAPQEAREKTQERGSLY